jgi:hypothetical protein
LYFAAKAVRVSRKRLEPGSEADNLGFGEIRYRDQFFAADYAVEHTSWSERSGHCRDCGEVLRR